MRLRTKLALLNLVVSVLILWAFLVDAARAALTPSQHSNAQVISDVFGRYAGQARRVAWCESRWRTTARNGQYRGLFQMGRWERETFGHGPTARAQARAAWRYFVATGRDWSPWSCRYAA